jgi:lipid-A-disaccharide synthase-like uncharacterized protein
MVAPTSGACAKGQRLTGFVIASSIAIDVGITASYYVLTHLFTLQDVVRPALVAIIGIVAFQGRSWARWTLAGYYGLAAFVSFVRFFFRMSDPEQLPLLFLALAVLYSVLLLTLALSANIDAFFLSKKKHRIRRQLDGL